MRFRRTVYGAMADPEFETAAGGEANGITSSERNDPSRSTHLSWRYRKAVKPHAISESPLSKMRGARLRDWHSISRPKAVEIQRQSHALGAEGGAESCGRAIAGRAATSSRRNGGGGAVEKGPPGVATLS